MPRVLWIVLATVGVLVGRASAAPCTPTGSDLIVDAITCQLSGTQTFTNVRVINGGMIEVNAYTGGDKNATGNLELRAQTILVDATSSITAKGRGYQTRICGDGQGPLSRSGIGDSFTKSGNTMTLTDAGGQFVSAQVGRSITIYSATTAANNGVFTITAVPSATTIQYTNAAGVAENFAGSWIIDDGAGGQGGCAVRDSGGGGGHIGAGGRGTKDITSLPQTFPRDFEEDCGNTVRYDGTGTPSCSANSDCRTNDGLPTVAGQGYVHSIYVPEFGASGGDKGCRDGDGTTLMTAGPGGGRIVLTGLGGAGTVTINGTLDATGRRGCGNGNDSAGGGAGGTIVVVGDHVEIGATALITAAGGLGGDTQGGMSGGECPAPYQQSGTCDDCGGGGGGGLVSVLSVTSAIDDNAVFRVNGALGGVCPICNGEAGGGDGELQISNGYVGEFCDGYDNDFDDAVDENLGTLNCGTSTMMACIGGVPQTCAPDAPACFTPVTDTRARFAVVVDTSGTMLYTLGGVPTFGDGSTGHAGRDHDGDGLADDSRLFKAKGALTEVISAYPNVDFALARFHQDTALNRNCQLAHNFECNDLCCTYDNPGNNTGSAPTPACSVNGGTGGNVAVLKSSPGDECINYAGNCGPPRRGADVLVGFGADVNNHLMWLDGTETAYSATTTPGAFCNFASGGDCEIRATGPTPLASALQAMRDYLSPIKGCDQASVLGCRRYAVILLTDGAVDTCQGDPVVAAAELLTAGVNTYVIGFSTLAGETAQLNAIAAAGGTGTAFLANDQDALANTLAQIVSSSIVFETCNNLDDDCDTFVDEDFPNKGAACDNGEYGACLRPGVLECRGDGTGLQCNAPPGTPGTEVCNDSDDDCDSRIDEGLTCTTCVPVGETCNNADDDCDTRIDEGLTRACGQGTCTGTEVCTSGSWGGCTATPAVTEICNGADDDCDGVCDGLQTGCSEVNGACDPNDASSCPQTDNPGDPGNYTASDTAETQCADAIDNDLDGFINDGCAPMGSPETMCNDAGDSDLDGLVNDGCPVPALPIAQNICRPGNRVCPQSCNASGNSYGQCSSEVLPLASDPCNGLDDDCDNKIDEGFTPADCSTNCGVGQTACVNGAIQCNSTPASSDPTCNNVDDDCDNKIDEDWTCANPVNGMCPCGTGMVCGGLEKCINGAVVCQGTPLATETCNCLDEDCDTNVDEGTVCPSGATCTNCQCAFPCAPGEFPCPLGKKCDTGFCVNDPCFNVSCPHVNGNAQTCVPKPGSPNEPLCVDTCTTVSCASPLICYQPTGECRPDDCSTFPERCASNEVCVNGVCESNPCAGVQCPADQYCLAGACVASCADIECPEGQRCRQGVCETDPCGRGCPYGYACNDVTGECIEDPCKFRICPTGQWCNPNVGQCEDDPCVENDIKCPGVDEICRGGTCVDPDDLRPDAANEAHVTVGGGGGCNTSGGANGVLLALALVFVRRRRRRGEGV